MTVEKLIREKGRRVATVRPDVRVRDVVRKLAVEDVGALVVSEDGKTILGIISERDVVRHLAQNEPDTLDRSVVDLMTKEVITCTPEDRIAGIMALMTEHRVRHVPVLDRGELCGIISIGDLVKGRLDEVMTEADAMLAYIRS